MQQLYVGPQDFIHEFFRDQVSIFIEEANGSDNCSLQLVLIDQVLQNLDEVELWGFVDGLGFIKQGDSVFDYLDVCLYLLLVDGVDSVLVLLNGGG